MSEPLYQQNYETMESRNSTTIAMPSDSGTPNLNQDNLPVDTYNYMKYILFIQECLGMATFITLSLSNIAIFGLLNVNISWEGVAISWGFNLLIGIKIASLSGGKAYLNPCIAVADYLVKNSISLCELGIYVLAELTGAFIGASVTYGLHRNLYKSLDDETVCTFFATYNADGINKIQATFVEFVGTFLFSYCIFSILNSKCKHVEYAISMSLTAVVLALGAQTAFSYNWARDFGPRLFISTIHDNCFSKNGNYWYVPLLADFMGAFMGAFMTEIVK